MISRVYIALVVAILLLTLGQVLQKVAVDRCGPVESSWQLALAAARNPVLWLAVGCLAGGLFSWLLVLRSLDVSKAFPFLSVGQVIVLLVAKFYFGETVSRSRWVGALAVITGIALIAGS
ncbi:MAG: EamA family transporter [Gammaproteobacteria bacterium]